KPFQLTQALLWPWLLFSAWMVLVLLIASQHEFWRDEVRALSIAMDASSLSDLFRLMQDEGHPMLWHLLLYGGYQVSSSKLVLPAVSIAIAAVAVWLFAFFSLFPPWFKALFIFSGLPLYEYSVMARNYGISMLLLFLFASLYPLRHRHPAVLGLVLALLCHTNVHSAMLACLLLCLWLWDTWGARGQGAAGESRRQLVIATPIFLIGLSTALYTVWPSGNQIVFDPSRYNVGDFVWAFWNASLRPSKEFTELFPDFLPWTVKDLVLFGAMSGLIARPALLLLALTALTIFGMFFHVIYTGFYRHQGLLVCFLITLYWIMLAERGDPKSDIGRPIFRTAVLAGLTLLVICVVWTGAQRSYLDWSHEVSSSKTLHAFLQTHPEFTDAILIGEPDYYLESVRYY